MTEDERIEMLYGKTNKPMTNADRIRSMTDEEIATLIILNCQGRECPDTSFCRSEEEAAERCWKCWLEWLKQEYTP